MTYIQNTEKLMADACAEANLTPQQLSDAATVVLRTLHKVAYADEKDVTAALMQCRWLFGEEACYHLGGILEEARFTEPHLPWSETILRMGIDVQAIKPNLEDWDALRTETRRQLDANR